ncbi:NAD(P)/FAD-dependent oxidoreductase [Pseudomonas sp. nanlin1]|uniref:NAD(P)/FAD-dependent oxidoreductase n=1 Tax=Pseudomonas sp. nanlin1 TaxID=3040605 RepID=UPI00388E3B5C
MKVVVIGAGIVGACCALELLRDGHQVTLLEPGEPGAEQAASHGNGAWLSPASIVPMALPGLWKKVPGFLLDPDGPLTIRWQALPRLLPWLARFILAGSSVARVERTARHLRQLLQDAPARHLALAAEAGASDLLQQHGLLYAYPDRAAFDAEALAWRLRRDNGVQWAELDGPALRTAVPDLSERYSFGVWVEAGANCLNPGDYVAALVAHAQRCGAHLQRGRALGLRGEGGRLRGVLSSVGELPCERAVLACGIHSQGLAQALGDRVPMASERGYNVVLRDTGVHLSMPVMPSDGKMANTSTTAGLRISGQVELASVDAPANWRRSDVLLHHGLNSYPKLEGRHFDPQSMTRWLGHRPSVADGLPVIGPSSACADVIHAFGHGHIGLAAGPISGRLVADLIAATPAVVDPWPYRAGRFQTRLGAWLEKQLSGPRKNRKNDLLWVPR